MDYGKHSYCLIVPNEPRGSSGLEASLQRPLLDDHERQKDCQTSRHVYMHACGGVGVGGGSGGRWHLYINACVQASLKQLARNVTDIQSHLMYIIYVCILGRMPAKLCWFSSLPGSGMEESLVSFPLHFGFCSICFREAADFLRFVEYVLHQSNSFFLH